MNIENLINKELKEFSLKQKITGRIKEATVIAQDTKFNLRTGVNKNPTKLGIKIQFEPRTGLISPDTKSQLEVALQEKLNKALGEFDIQVSKDTDVPRENTIGFFIPLSQIKNLVVSALGGKTEKPKVAAPSPPKTPTPPPTPTPVSTPPPAVDNDEEELKEQIINEALRVRDLNEISKVVYKEDFYGFVNAGQNVMRTLEEHGFESKMAKKYLEHLVKNNIL
tara:strand:- start:747 stop:1415 length:669 start_codon:yes stop_codon:yes gene_type:complete